jgi:hypothetical protein
MGETAEATVACDSSLRFALFGLECATGVEFSAKEVERVFLAAREDQVSAKEFLFVETARLRVSGYVEEYEPETIKVRVECNAIDQRLLDSIVERAKYQAFRCKGDAGP